MADLPAAQRSVERPLRRLWTCRAEDVLGLHAAMAKDRERIGRVLVAAIHNLFAVGLSLQAAAIQVSDPELSRTLSEAVQELDRTVRELSQDLVYA